MLVSAVKMAPSPMGQRTSAVRLLEIVELQTGRKGHGARCRFDPESVSHADPASGSSRRTHWSRLLSESIGLQAVESLPTRRLNALTPG